MPVLYYLAGLTSTEGTLMIRGGAQRLAAEHGLMLTAPGTSPRTANVPGEDGFYLDATEGPWAGTTGRTPTSRGNYRLSSRRTSPPRRARGVFGHSMGGNGALVCALRNPDLFRSVSAFAPISAPTRVPWGEKAFIGYLGGTGTTTRSGGTNSPTPSLRAAALTTSAATKVSTIS